MPKPRYGGKPSFRGLARAAGHAVGKIAIKVYVCHGCGLEYKGERPQQCACGRMDFAKYDSMGEAARYAQLRLKVMAGLIRDLETQVRFPLMTICDGRPVKVATYIADFVYVETEGDKQIIEDFKGALTDVAALKLRWMAAQGQPVKLVTKEGIHRG